MTWSMISALNWKVFSVWGSTRVWRGWLKREPSGLAAVWPNVNGDLLDPGIYTGVYFHLMDFLTDILSGCLQDNLNRKT